MISVKRSVPIIFAVLVFASSTIIIATYYFTGRSSVNSLLDELVFNVTRSVVDSTVSFLSPARELGEIVGDMSTRSLIPELNGDYFSKSSVQYKENKDRVDDMMEYFDKKELKKYKVTEGELKGFLLNKTSKSIGILKLFNGFLITHEQINLINYGSYNKDKVMLKRMPDGSFSIKYVYHYVKKGIGITFWHHSNSEYYIYSKISSRYDFSNKISPINKTYNVVLRPWFLGAEREFKRAKSSNSKAEAFWTKPYVFYSDQVPGISCSNPLVNSKGKMVGAISVSLTIFNISAKYLANLEVGKNGKVFIMTNKANMLAYTPTTTKISGSANTDALIKKELMSLITQMPRYSKEDKTKIIGYKFVLTHIDKLKNSIYREAFSNAKASGLLQKTPSSSGGEGFTLKNKHVYNFDYNKEPTISVLFPFPSASGFNWIGGIIIPEDDFLGQIKFNTYLVVGFSIITTMILFILSVYIFSKISIPLNKLSDATKKIKEFDLSVLIDIETPLVEIKQMSNSIDNMVSGLRSFEKYVPSDLVKHLVRSGREAKLEATSKNMSVFFSDVVGFTDISERLSPTDLVIALGEYLEEMSSIIIDNEGTVDKYIGDAVMSFWGAPEPCEDHAFLACKAAIESQKRLAMLRYSKWKPENKPLFEARIGINTGDLVVGNVGSDSRMNYTVLGDTVNLGSRLEGLNKYYGTNIICSEYTYKLIKSRIFTRKLDTVAVKGKTNAIGIYEVVGFIDEVSGQNIEFARKYEEAVSYYLQKELNIALTLFKEANAVKTDLAAKLFIERCNHYIKEGLPSDWNGVYVFTTK